MDSMREDQNGNVYALLANGNVLELVPEPGMIGVVTMLIPFSSRRLRLRGSRGLIR